MRGVVSLAAALAIPYFIDNGSPFPHRDMILFVTFGVIIFTLVGQGLMLPKVVRWLGLSRLGKEERLSEVKSELDARVAALRGVESGLRKSSPSANCPTRWSNCCARAIKAACRSCRRI